jgi:hypothetical protein
MVDFPLPFAWHTNQSCLGISKFVDGGCLKNNWWLLSFRFKNASQHNEAVQKGL